MQHLVFIIRFRLHWTLSSYYGENFLIDIKEPSTYLAEVLTVYSDPVIGLFKVCSTNSKKNTQIVFSLAKKGILLSGN